LDKENSKEMILQVKVKEVGEKGGPGSGNWGHAGIPGSVGGSIPRDSGMSIASGSTWLERYEAAKGKPHPYALELEKERAEFAALKQQAREEAQQGKSDKMKYPRVEKGSYQAELVRNDKLLNSPDVLKKVQVPEYLYHVTDRSNIDSVMQKGILTGIPRSSSEGLILGAYLTDDPRDIIAHQSDIRFKDPVVIRVRTAGLKLRLDPEYFAYGPDSTKADALEFVAGVNAGEEQYAMYSTTPIPTGNLEVTDKW